MDQIKKHQVGLRLSDTELARLRRVASCLGIGAHEAVRLLLKEKDDELASQIRQGAR